MSDIVPHSREMTRTHLTAGNCMRALVQGRKADYVEVRGRKVEEGGERVSKTVPISQFGPDFPCPFHPGLYTKKYYHIFIFREDPDVYMVFCL